ncbi:N2227-like protein-domain-containing protein [Coniella lustricola]|uniref:carnosine N-methyltransferase n=1 Tax=Coniella lustricola TaxID=2025994 RepID=A0A2T3AG34_9PEZI|nr:N2227-like protein-domain-containing protein [Coniella lustricola]
MDESDWQGIDKTVEDPEEARVMFCALDSFLQYGKVAHFNCTHLRRQSFYALPEAHWKMLAAPPFNYLETLDKVDAAIDSNAELAKSIVRLGLRSFQVYGDDADEKQAEVMPEQWAGVAKYSDIDKARSTLRQFYRDWSAEGREEREASYGPIKRALAAERARKPGLEHLKVLVPGAGLGRLVFDLSLAGFDTEGNEISYHQLIASSYILNYVHSAGQHTIYPWIHTFSNHNTRDRHLKGFKIPDIHPATEMSHAEGPGPMSMCAADFLCLYSDEEHKDAYDAVASVFFLDTAPNLIRYLETIFYCLKPGGALINIGPLLWHFENNAPGNHGHDDDGDGEHDASNSSGIADPGSFELSAEEVMALVEKIGFVVEAKESGIKAPYIQDPESMLQTIYHATFWVARKPTF